MTRVGMLAPMQPELQPLVRLLGLTGDGETFHGTAGSVEIVAMLTNIGMSNGAAAAARMIDVGVDCVMVVGIAGGVDRSVAIGEVIAPESIVDRRNGREFKRPVNGPARGVLSCGDDLITDPGTLAAMSARGIIAVDMETAAIAGVCEDAGQQWMAFRSISDYAGEGLIDDALFALTRPDGTADRDAVARYLAENPGRGEVLARLAHDANLATEAAATAAIRACAEL